MPLTAIVTIVLRIFSLLWLVDGIVKFFYAYQMAQSLGSRGTPHSVYLEAGILLLIAFVVFVFSHPIARLVTPPPNPEVNLGTLSRYDLYCFAFTFLGLYFFLSSFSSAINWVHYYIVNSKTVHEGQTPRDAPFYSMTRPLLTSIAGLVSLLMAPRFARKLTAVQQKQSAA